MDINIFSLFAIFIGLSFGSFFTTLAYRYDYFVNGQGRRKKTHKQKCKEILITPSHCLSCNSKIKSVYLFPVLGYFFSFGKCFNCNKKFTSAYVWGEIYFGIFTFLFFKKYFQVYFESGFLPNLNSAAVSHLTNTTVFLYVFVYIFSLLLIGILYIIIYTDFQHFFIENKMIVLLFLTSLVLVVLQQSLNEHAVLINLWLRLKVAIAAFVFFLTIFIFSKGAMGYGDVLLSFSLGFISSHPWWMFSFNAGFIMAVAYGILMYLHDKRMQRQTESNKKVLFRKRKLAMGSFLGLGVLFVLLMQLIQFNNF